MLKKIQGQRSMNNRIIVQQKSHSELLEIAYDVKGHYRCEL